MTAYRDEGRRYFRDTSPKIHHEAPRLGHFLHGVPDAFASKATVFHPAVGHIFHAEGWDLIDHHSSDVEAFVGAEGFGDIWREDSRLKAKSGVVNQGQRLLEAIVGLEHGERGKGLLAGHRRVAGGVFNEDTGAVASTEIGHDHV